MYFDNDHWEAAKKSLAWTMTRATYEQWIARAQLQHVNGQIQIIVAHQLQAEWLETRLKKPILRAINDQVDEEIPADRLVFVARDDAPTLSLTGESGAKLSLPDFYSIWKKTGYSPLAHYVTRFWLPYLKPAVFAIWKAIESTDTRPVTDTANRWTRPREYKYRRLTEMIGASARRTVSGAKRECNISLKARLQDQSILADCAQCPHHIHLRELDADHVSRCKYWQPGALEILFKEKLLALETTKLTPSENSRIFRLSVYRVLPLLTPYQVQFLPKYIQRDHENWLKTYQKTLRITLHDWENIEERTLVSAQSGYYSHKPLDGYYQFNRILAMQESAKVVPLAPL